MSGPLLASLRRLVRPGRWSGEGWPRLGRVNHVSLGSVCHMASALRSLGLRGWTGPFDWVFSTPALVTECLQDDFATYLDPAHLRSVPPGELLAGAKRQGHHPAIEARHGLPILFNHHDPAGSAADRASLGRAVDRLRTALTEPGQRNVFYVMAVDCDLPGPELDTLGAAIAAFPARSGLVEVSIVTGTDGQRSLRSEPGRLTTLPSAGVRLRTGSAWRALSFADAADDAALAEGILRAASMVEWELGSDPTGVRAAAASR